MSIRIGVGISENSDSFQAGREAARETCHKAQEDLPDLLLVFASSKFHHPKLLQGIASICPEAVIAGCTTAGEISSLGPTKNSVVIMGIKSPAVQLSAGIGYGLGNDARSAGQRCAQQAVRERLQKRQVFIMLPDGLSENVSDAIRGAQEVLGTSFPIVGGSAGDDSFYKASYQFYHDKVFNDAIVGLLIGGDVAIGIGVRHGWHAIGKAHEVTKAAGNVIAALDNKKAFSIYQDYFGEEADSLKKSAWAKLGTIYPLGMSIPGEEEYLIRYPFKADEEERLICAAEVPQGSYVRLMIADKDTVLQAAKEAALKAKEAVLGKDILGAVIFDSIARKRILGRDAREEINIIQDILGKTVPLIGFYTYGEQAPLKAERYIGKSYFHNETIVIIAIAKAAEPKVG